MISSNWNINCVYFKWLYWSLQISPTFNWTRFTFKLKAAMEYLPFLPTKMCLFTSEFCNHNKDTLEFILHEIYVQCSCTGVLINIHGAEWLINKSLYHLPVWIYLPLGKKREILPLVAGKQGTRAAIVIFISFIIY